MRVSMVVTLLASAMMACAIPGDESRPDPGNPVPAFEAANMEGDTVSLASLRGQPLLLNLWATWCLPCRTETPYLQSIYERLGPQGLQMVGLSVDTRSASSDVEEFIEEFGVSYLILHDPTMSALDVFAVLGLPATFLIDADGVIRWKRMGPILEGDPEFESALRQTLEG